MAHDYTPLPHPSQPSRPARLVALEPPQVCHFCAVALAADVPPTAYPLYTSDYTAQGQRLIRRHLLCLPCARRIDFIGWLVDHRRLSDWPGGVDHSMKARAQPVREHAREAEEAEAEEAEAEEAEVSR